MEPSKATSIHEIDLNEKACLVASLAQEEYQLLKEGGCHMRGGLIGWLDDYDVFQPANKQELIWDMIVEYGFWLRPSEVERELFPAVLARFHGAREIA